MKTTIITCDKCKVRVERDRCKLLVESGSLRGHWPVVDLCQACASAFGAWLTESEDSEQREVDGRETRC